MQGLYEWSHLQNFSLYVVSEAQAAGELPSYDFALSNGWFTFMVHAFSSILLPNDNGPPWYDFPLDSDGKLIDALFQQIFEQDIYAIVEREAANAEDLELYFDVGLQDNTVPGHAENLAAALDGLGWPYVFHTYPGGHGGDDFVLHRIWVHVTHFMPIKATAEISPRVADPRLYPQRLRVAVELPGDLEVDDIDCSTLSLVDIDGSRLDCPIGCSSACEISDVNGNGRDDLSVWLPCDATVRAAIEGGAEPGDQVELTVRGELDDGRFFAATDTVTLGSGLVAVAAVD
jgi:hypothetical protein